MTFLSLTRKLAFTVLVTHLFKDTLDSVFYGFHTSRCFFRITSILCILDSHKLIQERLPCPTHRHSFLCAVFKAVLAG